MKREASAMLYFICYKLKKLNMFFGSGRQVLKNVFVLLYVTEASCSENVCVASREETWFGHFSHNLGGFGTLGVVLILQSLGFESLLH